MGACKRLLEAVAAEMGVDDIRHPEVVAEAQQRLARGLIRSPYWPYQLVPVSRHPDKDAIMKSLDAWRGRDLVQAVHHIQTTYRLTDTDFYAIFIEWQQTPERNNPCP